MRRALLLLLALASALAAQETVATLTIEPRQGEVDLLMRAELTVTGPRLPDCEVVGVPEIDGARLDYEGTSGTSTKLAIVNGRATRQMTKSWVFRLVPERAGTLVVGSFTLDCGGEALSTKPTTLPVTASSLDEVVGLSIEADRDEVWVGESFTVDVEAWILESWAGRLLADGLRLELPWYDGNDGVILVRAVPPSSQSVAKIELNGQEILTLSQHRVTRPGEEARIALRRRFELMATRAGALAPGPSRFSARLARTIERRRDPIFNSTRSVVTSESVASAEADFPALAVKAPPALGRPVAFTNAVGDFQFSGTAAPRSLAVGETCRLALALSGSGNLEFVRFPEFAELQEDFRIFGKEEREEFGMRILEFELSPKNDRVEEIPRLELATFDPADESYHVLAVGPFDLDVEPGGEEGLASLETPQEILRDLETIRTALPEPSGGGVPPWLLWAPPLLLLLGVEATVRVRRWRAEHPAAVARRRGRRRLAAALDEAATARDVAVAFAHYLADRFDGPPAGLTADEAAARLPAGDPLAARLRETCAAWDAAWLGGGTLDVELARTQAAELADELEARP